MDKFRRSNTIFHSVRDLLNKYLRPVLDQENLTPADREVTKARLAAACDFGADVACLFDAYNSLADNNPDSVGLLRALNSLAFGFETNLFYGTFKGYLHPILMHGINGYIDANFSDNMTAEDQKVISRTWTAIYPAIAFCLGNTSMMRSVGYQIQAEVLRIVK